jgi:YidC/Oxa1 family membrane protein insertase
MAFTSRRCNSTAAAAAEVETASTSLVSAASQMTELKLLGFGSWTSPFGIIQNTFDLMHSYCGLPWWGTIAMFTVCMRLTLLPFSWQQAKLAHRQLLLKPHISTIQEKMNEFKARGLEDQYRQETAKYWGFMGTHGCSPFKMLSYGLMPLPFYVSTFIALRQLLTAPVPSMQTGGLSWFADLCASDPYFILPVATSAMLLLNIEVNLLLFV